MVALESPEVVVQSLMREGATCELTFVLEGRQVGRLEMKDGKVRHAEMSGIKGGSAARIIKRLPSKTRAVVRYLDSVDLGPKTVNSGAWEIPR